MAFKLKEEEPEEHCESRYQFAESSSTEAGFLTEEKILLQHHTVLDRDMVSGKDALSLAWQSMLSVEWSNPVASKALANHQVLPNMSNDFVHFSLVSGKNAWLPMQLNFYYWTFSPIYW